MLFHDANIDGRRSDLRTAGNRIVAIAPLLVPIDGETIIDARGGTLIPGLHDHHIHLSALAAAAASADCGPPLDAAGLRACLRARAGAGWIRGVGYHPSIAGNIDRDWLDAIVRDVPVRIQHRGGRLWILNSCALDLLLAGSTGPDPLERHNGRPTGRLYDGDLWLRARSGGMPSGLAAVSVDLARFGITGLTDAGHSNGVADLDRFRAEQHRGALLQDLLVMGGASLDMAPSEPGLQVGPRKFHLHDNYLPDPDQLILQVTTGRHAGRAAAFHCVTVAELVVALRCIEDAGGGRGDRIEHGAMIPPDLVDWIARLGVTVVTQPNFIAERGDSYRREIAPEEHAWLYRCASLRDAGVPVAIGSDAPYGGINPWATMQAAVTRRTAAGVLLGDAEPVSPEIALAMFTTAPDDPGGNPRRLRIGGPADLCLLDRPWHTARRALGDVTVRLTLKAGNPIWVDPDQPDASPLGTCDRQSFVEGIIP